MTDEAKPLVSMNAGGVVLSNMDDAWRFCKAVFESGLAPKSYKSIQSVFVAMQAGAELGFSPMASLRAFAVINESPAIVGHAALAKIRQSPLCEKCELSMRGDGDDFCAVVTLKRVDAADEVDVTYSVADAKRAKLWGKKTSSGKDSPWILHPDDMLTWKAVSRAAKRYFSDVLFGLEIAEVQRDYGPPIDGATTEERQPPAEPDPLLADIEEEANAPS